MSLRAKIMSGGLYLALRQAIGMTISLGGMLLLTRLIGPEKYGLYTAVFGIAWYLQIISQLGVEVYLVRRSEREEHLNVYHQAFTLLLLLALIGMSIGLCGIPLLQVWTRLDGFSPVAQAMFLPLPLILMSQVPMAKIERDLDYKRVAIVELANQAIFFLVAIPLAVQGSGVWAPVAGWWVQQIQSLILLLWLTQYKPKFYWDPKLVRQMLSYSIGFSASSWIWQARVLVNPMLVGRYGGSEVVGYVALAIRMVEVLGFVKQLTWRLSLAALAKIQDDNHRLRKAINEGMPLQVLILGPFLVGLAWVLPMVLPVLFGSKWLPVLQVYPFIALASLTNSLFNLHCSVLYVLKRNWEVTLFHVINVGSFAIAVTILLPRLGLVGYGWAEMIAFISYIVVHFYSIHRIGQLNYGLPLFWWVAFGAALFVWQGGWWMASGLAVVALLPVTRRTIQGYVTSLKGSQA
jgi:PST family polysaccharide transporter